MNLLDVSDISLAFPNKPLFQNLSFTIKEGEKMAILGVNGSGKSTLLSVLHGEYVPDTGIVRRRQHLSVGALSQRPSFTEESVREVVGESWQAKAAIDRLGLSNLMGTQVATLSGGELKRLALAALLQRDDYDLILLDEPTNHLDIEGIKYLEGILREFRGGVVFVSHDRHLVDRVATKTLELDADESHMVSGGYEDHLRAKADRARKSERDEAARLTLARKELAWLQRGAKARRRKPKSRIAVAQQTITGNPKEHARSRPLDFQEFGQQRLGRKVIDLENVSFATPDRTLFENVTMLIASDSRIGIVGPNGSGKSTLLNAMAGLVSPTGGKITNGSTVNIGYFDQMGTTLDQSSTVEEIIAGPGSRLGPSEKALLRRFWFEPETHRAKVETLSGGEQRRLQLLAILAAKPNVLLLDEPTNDLDIETLRALEDWLDDFDGALVAVTHDRSFLERVTEHVVVVGPSGFRHLGAGEAVWEEAKKKVELRSGGRQNHRRDSPSSGRSMSTLRHLLRELDTEIDVSTEQRDALIGQMEEPDLTPQDLQQLSTSLAVAVERLEAAEENWLEISDEMEKRA